MMYHLLFHKINVVDITPFVVASRWLWYHVIMIIIIWWGHDYYNPIIHGEILPIQTTLDTNDRYNRVRFYTTMIRGPGFVDVQNLVFQNQYSRYAHNIDMVIFHVPTTCALNITECNFSDYGVGFMYVVSSSVSVPGICCYHDSKKHNMCPPEGQLVLNETTFHGDHKVIPIKYNYGKRQNYSIPYNDSIIRFNDSGTYIILFANCIEQSTDVVNVTGSIMWKSVYGYIPVNKYGPMIFFVGIWMIYIVLGVWYGSNIIQQYSTCTIIEKGIFGVILLAFIPISFKVQSLYHWNHTGYKPTNIEIYRILNSLKHGISKCLFLTLSMGWNVIQNSVVTVMYIMMMVGMIYICLTVLSDVEYIAATHDVNNNNIPKYYHDYGISQRSTELSYLIVLIFIVWTLGAMHYTIVHIRNTNQTLFLVRYQILRLLFICYIILSFLSPSLLIRVISPLSFNSEHMFCVDEATYVFLLIGTAILWRPPNIWTTIFQPSKPK